MISHRFTFLPRSLPYSAMKKHPSFLALTLCASLLPLCAPAPAQPTAEKVIVPKTRKAKATTKKTAATAGTAFVRVLHAMPDGPSVDVYAGSTKIASGLSFKSMSDYMEVKSGKTQIKVVSAGKTEPALASDSGSLTKGKYFTLAVYGKKTASLLRVPDSGGKEMPDKARVRIVHLSPGTPAVLVTAPSTRAKAGYTKFIAKPLEYGASASKSAKPMTTKLQLRSDDGKVIKETEDIQLEAGKRYDAFAVGELDGTGASAFDVLVKPVGQ